MILAELSLRSGKN